MQLMKSLRCCRQARTVPNTIKIEQEKYMFESLKNHEKASRLTSWFESKQTRVAVVTYP